MVASALFGSARSLSVSAKMSNTRTLEEFASRADLSWTSRLSEDPEAAKFKPNKESRQVKSGHYVGVAPTKLPDPELVMYSEELSREMGLSEEDVLSERFARFVSGDTEALSLGGSWATPYALSIMGKEMYNNCPFGNGNGYGDGRAISIGEVVVDDRRYELQLKGAGRTPFCRGADGRAVLRSSLREFLASEAMHFLGVETTRALSLVKSKREIVRRGWYSNASGGVTEDDPRLKHLPLNVRRQLVRELRGQMDVAVEEPAAITCRVAKSFVRVGHLDLFARRASGTPTPTATAEHRAMVEHALFREYPEILAECEEIEDAAIAMAEKARDNFAKLAADWLRVGFAQGNFNADNCLVAGRTMDYGPFGFMDEYDPGFAKWVGSGEHFAFAAQPRAAQVNHATLVKSLLPLMKGDETRVKRLRELVETAEGVFKGAVEDCYARKLGFARASPESTAIWHKFEPILRQGLDYTIAFRELATFDASRVVDRALYHESKREEVLSSLSEWMGEWRNALDEAGVSPETATASMNATNPKYVLREWMLVQAYDAAYQGDLTIAYDLHRLIKAPFHEQPEFEARYYRRADSEDLSKPGTAFMT